MTFQITAPGIYLDVSASDYFGDPTPGPSFTQSLAKVILNKSPRHAWLQSPKLNPEWSAGDSEGYDADRAIGNAAHAYMLGRGKHVEVMQFNNFRTRDAQEIRNAAFDAGRVPILPHHNERAVEMVIAARTQLDERGYHTLFDERYGKSEVVVACQWDGLWVRSMIDWLGVGNLSVIDYKTGGMNCAPDFIDAKMKSSGVEIQAAMHEFILDILTPENAGRRVHIFVFQENEPPYALNAFPLSEEWLTMGRKQLGMAANRWRDCIRSNEWPLYPLDAQCPPYPGYQMSKILEREIVHEERRSREPMLTELAGG